MPYNPLKPPPAPPAFGQDKVVPEEQASYFSRLIFSWLDPFLKVGFSRPLQKEDLWQLPDHRLTGNLSDTVERNFYARCSPEQRPVFLRDTIAATESQRTDSRASSAPSNARNDTVEDEKHNVDDKVDIDLKVSESDAGQGQSGNDRIKRTTVKKPKKYDGSLVRALHYTFFWTWWIGGILTLFASVLQTTTPLLNKVILTWLTDSYAWSRLSAEERAASGLTQPHGVGYGIGLAFALFVMQEASSLMTQQYMLLTMTTGLTVRTSVIGAIFRKSLRLSGRARQTHSVGQITTMISADAARIERVTSFAHNLWVLPTQIIIGVGLLIGTLGYSALVGVGVLILGLPLQVICVRTMFIQRKKGVVLTDQRVRLLTEVLQGIRFLKFYAWEDFYADQIGTLREREVDRIRLLGIARGWLISVVTMVPVLAAVLSFVTYALSGHNLSVAVIFTSLQFFNVIRAPLMYFPMVLAASTDAAVALGRISRFLVAEERVDTYTVDPACAHAVEVEGDFQWETADKSAKKPKFDHGGSGGSKNDEKKKKEKKEKVEERNDEKRRSFFSRKEKGDLLPTKAESTGDAEKEKDETPFELKDLKLSVPKGSFVAIVGSIGSGKSSLLQALIGEMRKKRGHVVFSSSVAYVPQTAWIMNASLRQNITFGESDDEEAFRDIVKACCLEPDLRMLPYGEETEIGEKGINLSGGQKARVSLARAAYSGADIVLMDDSLSAVDAYVGKAILENCLLSGPLAGKTRILVTHALHVLDKTDYIYVMDDGVIVEQGTYKDLMNDSLLFSRIMEEYGSLDKEKQDVEARGEKDEKQSQEKHDANEEQSPLMQAEERLTGAVSYNTYARYLRNAGGLSWAPTIFALLVLVQCAQVGNNLFLGFWTAQSIPGFVQGDYIAVYTAFGVASSIFTLLLAIAFTYATLVASLRMFKSALKAVLASPVSFYDTTPMGRIMSRLSNDQDTLDTQIATTGFQLLNTVFNVLGTVALVFYTFPYLGIIFVPLMLFYYIAAIYYRRSSVETKRLDSLMRSALYAAYSETLTGLSTVRAYGAQSRFVKKSEEGLDMENRAYYMTVAIQQWLGTRLDILGNILVLGIALFAAGFRTSVNPSKIGVVLSYTLSITQTFSQLVAQYAQNEQNFNSVERVLHFTDLPPEGDMITPNDPPPSWPEQGKIEFKNVELAYREGLPFVLKGVTFTVNPGEKVGIIGRTGAGKSSLLQGLFRAVDVQGGSIEIDGKNIRDIGLHVLRGRLALVPQDNILFKGTLRENLDPQKTRSDGELISALQRAWLLPHDGTHDPVADAKFSLDCSVNDEGSNYSAGEKQLLALCRALVKNSRIIVLDEATSNVDPEMDAKVQKTIQTEFTSSTLLCIAHRLNTIAYYDRVLVMNAGKVEEFDTPLNLFDREDSIFRSLCNEANLTRQDIVRIRASVPQAGAA